MLPTYLLRFVYIFRYVRYFSYSSNVSRSFDFFLFIASSVRKHYSCFSKCSFLTSICDIFFSVHLSLQSVVSLGLIFYLSAFSFPCKRNILTFSRYLQNARIVYSRCFQHLKLLIKQLCKKFPLLPRNFAILFFGCCLTQNKLSA